MHAARSFRTRLIDQFRSAENTAYLRELLSQATPPGRSRDFLLENLDDMVTEYDLDDLIASDPLAQRGMSNRSASFWDEIKRLNRAFYTDRMEFIRSKRALIEYGDDPGDMSYIDNVFESQLYPEGYESLNGMSADRLPMHAARRYGAGLPMISQHRTRDSMLAERSVYRDRDPDYEPSVPFDETPAVDGRFNRVEGIPFWQRLSRNSGGIDRDTFDQYEGGGSQMRESDNPVYRVDMSRVRSARGEEYRTFGPR